MNRHRLLPCDVWYFAAEQTEDAPQSPEETVEMVRSVSHDRAQQRAAEQTEDAPQSPEETVEMVRVGLTRTSATASRRAGCASISRREPSPEETVETGEVGLTRTSATASRRTD